MEKYFFLSIQVFKGKDISFHVFNTERERDLTIYSNILDKVYVYCPMDLLYDSNLNYVTVVMPKLLQDIFGLERITALINKLYEKDLPFLLSPFFSPSIDYNQL